jgi:hypothetical protein
MSNLDIQTVGGVRRYDSGEVTLNTSTWTRVGSITVSAIDARCIIQISVAGSALTALKVTRGALPGAHDDGIAVDLAVDADLNSATDEVLNVLPLNAYTAAAGTEVQIAVNCEGAVEIGVYAKSDGGTARMRGVVPLE